MLRVMPFVKRMARDYARDYRDDFEEVYGEMVLAVVEAWPQYDPRWMPTTYAGVVCRNAMGTRRRRQASEERLAREWLRRSQDHEPWAELPEELLDALGEDRDLVMRKIVHGETYRALADELGMSREGVRWRVMRGIRDARMRMDPDGLQRAGAPERPRLRVRRPAHAGARVA